ncbi:MAG: TonB-dependent receptor plug domain-containing protein, partial [Bacteroidales bacterium]|nr:TonB-dependent receptor plug domain-containing protein [Bacteroidales bacterium]
MKIKAYILFATCFLPVFALAQTLSGRVLDNNRKPIPYAYVYIEGKNCGTQADVEGRFRMTLPPKGSYMLTASCVTFKKTQVMVSAGDTAVVIVMKADNLLEVVTITGTRTPKTLAETPVVTRIISQHDIEMSDATNVKDLLEAELPGLEFTYSMNQQVSISLQGMGGMSVLFLVDGERLAGETLDNTDFQRLSMDNIEKIEIVKGAATALYGSNA